MQRSKYRALLKLSYNLVCNKLAAYEFLCSVYNSVTYSLDILKCLEDSVFLVKKGIKDSLDTDCVVLDRHFLYKRLLTSCLVLNTTNLHSYPLDNTFGKKIINFVVLHIKKLIFK